jgi:thymidylate synthase
MLGTRKQNRTGVDTVGYIGEMCQYDMDDGFPIVTSRRIPFSAAVGEMLGFLRGYTSAAQFRSLGVKFWDANANENTAWLSNTFRKGQDDLGRIYGAQARYWWNESWGGVDQLKMVIDDLSKGIDNRREIVTHWNPSELNQMALPPCHMIYQFSLQGGRLHLSMMQRSCDLPLGVPFNISGYAWLLCTVARITGHEPGVFTHFLVDVHIYENQIDIVREQLQRKTHPLPRLRIAEAVKTLGDLETWVTPDEFQLSNYVNSGELSYPFSV